jgi:hypothetical protein
VDRRRPDGIELLQIAAATLALAVYVYAIGWVVTWTRLAAVRLPTAVSLPAIDAQVVFATGVRAVLVMVIVFAAMCALAYAVHWGRWDDRAEAWGEIVRSDRLSARHRLLVLGAKRPARPRRAPHPRRAPTPQERMVRVIAGFNVGVLAAALGLVAGRFAKTLIDQWQPGHWWALLAPWALFTILAALALAAVNPLRGGRLVHGVLWLAVIVVAMFTSAPVGLLVLTWAGIGTFGRWYGRRPLPASTFDFLRSPLPWLLLTIYALVALAYSAMPPVGFSQTVVQTSQGSQLGGYLARTGAGVYLVSCTPLADATSAGDRVQLIPAGIVRSVSTGEGEYTLDTGYRPSLPTLALRALGVEAQIPAWIRPELKERRAPCAGSPPPQPSGGEEDPRLGSRVFAGPAPPGGRARDGETPIEQTTPELAELAKRFQPTLLVSGTDPFWPMSVDAVLEDLGAGQQPTCLHLEDKRGCAVEHPTPSQLQPQGSSAGDFLEYPASPALSQNPEGQLEAFMRGQLGRGTPAPSLREWLTDPGVRDPWASAQIYFFYAGTAEPQHWPARPARGQKIESGLVGLQYWFFYPYNYYPTIVEQGLMNDAPLAADVANTDLHQGDWEHVTVLVDPRTREARWLYMARHSNEGEYVPWNSPLLSFDEGHPIVQAAYGGHPTYEAGCGPRHRDANGLKGLVSDWLVCGPGRLAFRASTTPLVDLASTPWACWKGHFGVAPQGAKPAGANEGSVALALEKYYDVAGPRSPLWQAENGHLLAEGANKPESGFCLHDDPQAPEREAIRDGLGRQPLETPAIAPSMPTTVAIPMSGNSSTR